VHKLEFFNEHLSNFHDYIFLKVMLCWYLNQIEIANRSIVAAVVSVFNIVPRQASSDIYIDRLAPMSVARQVYMLVVASQLQLLLWIGGNAADLMKPLYAETDDATPCVKFIKDSVVVLMGSAVRAALMFSSLPTRCDVVSALLKKPMVVPFKEDAVVESHANHFEVPKGDPGYANFVNLSRSEAIEALQDLPEGSFVLRPSDTTPSSSIDALAFYLSMRVDEEVGVKHAILRRKRIMLSISSSQRFAPKDGWSYRCGKVGPFGSLSETLKAVSELMPTPLLLADQCAVAAARTVMANRSTQSGRPVSARWDPNADFWALLIAGESTHIDSDINELGYELSDGYSPFGPGTGLKVGASGVGFEATAPVAMTSSELVASIMVTLVFTLSVRAMFHQLNALLINGSLRQEDVSIYMLQYLNEEIQDASSDPPREAYAILIAPLATFVLNSEKMIAHMISPPNLSRNCNFSPDLGDADRLMSVISESLMSLIAKSVPPKLMKVPGAGHDTTAFLIDYSEALRTLNSELQSNPSVQMMSEGMRCAEDADVSEAMLQWLRRHNVVKIYAKPWDTAFTGVQNMIRYIDPWEVISSIACDKEFI
jgi:hypothetical protein